MDLLSRLTAEIEGLKQRVIKQTATIERCTGDDMFEEKATLRNLTMQLEGLKLVLRKVQRKELKPASPDP